MRAVARPLVGADSGAVHANEAELGSALHQLLGVMLLH
jgi:hypothetical protein